MNVVYHASLCVLRYYVFFCMCRFSADSELSKICAELWSLYENRLIPGKDYAIDLQGGNVNVNI